MSSNMRMILQKSSHTTNCLNMLNKVKFERWCSTVATKKPTAKYTMMALHPMASKVDVRNLLSLDTEGMPKVHCTPCMDANYRPDGRWLLTLESTEEGVAKTFETAIEKRGGEIGDKLRGGKLQLMKLHDKDRSKLKTAEDLLIDASTVRLSRVHPDISVDMIHYLFQNLKVVSIDNMEALERNNAKVRNDKGVFMQTKEYMVKFQSPEQAELAVMQFGGMRFLNKPLEMMRYNI